MSVAILAAEILMQELRDYLVAHHLPPSPTNTEGDYVNCVGDIGEVESYPPDLVPYVYATTHVECPSVLVDHQHMSLRQHVQMYRRPLEGGRTG